MKKLFAGLIFCCSMLFIFPAVSNADEVVKTENFGEVSVEAIIESDLNIDFDVDITEIPTITSKNLLNPNEETKTFKADFFIPVPASSRASNSGSTTQQGITAYLTVTYDFRSSDSIKLSKVNGSWSRSSTLYVLSNRQVVAQVASVLSGPNKSWYPTSNTFSYDTGFSYSQYYPSGLVSFTGGRSFVTVYISGMGGSATVQLNVQI
jgi:hypothetical protein